MTNRYLAGTKPVLPCPPDLPAPAFGLQEALIVAHHQLCLDPLDKVQHHAHADQQPRPAEELGNHERDPKERGHNRRDDRDRTQEASTDVGDPFHNGFEVLGRTWPRAQPGDEAAVVAQVRRGLFGVELDGGPEVAEEVLERGDADMVSMARPFLADAFFVQKAIEGKKVTNTMITGYNDLDNQIELPAELQDSLEKSIQAITKQLTKAAKDNYQVAIEVAESRVASVIKKHEEKFEEFQQSELEAFQAVDAADKLNENLKSELSTLEKINDDLRQESAKFSGLVESLTSRLEYLDSKLDSKETELMKLVRENAELKGKFETTNLDK